jgi:hypothetical protein
MEIVELLLELTLTMFTKPKVLIAVLSTVLVAVVIWGIV